MVHLGQAISQVAEFWDTHDIAEYLDELEPVKIKFELEKPRDETILLRVQSGIKKQLERVAKSKGLNVSSLARMWLLEKLQSIVSQSR
jgi:hypothetical protein